MPNFILCERSILTYDGETSFKSLIDRGTDPMENYVPSSSNDASELQESNSSNNASNMQEPDTSNNSADLQESTTSNNSTNLQEPNVTRDLQESNISNITGDLQLTNTNASLSAPGGANNTTNSQEATSSNNSGDLPEPTISNNPAGSQESVSINVDDFFNISNNTAGSQDGDTAEIQETRSDNIEQIEQPHHSDNTTGLMPVSDISSDSREFHQSDISNPTSSVQDYASVSIQGNTETSVQPSGSCSVVSLIPKKHKFDTDTESHVPSKKFRKSETDQGEQYTSGSESPQLDNSPLLNQASGDLACHEVTNILSSTSSSLQDAGRNDSNDIETNQEVPNENVLETAIMSGDHVENTSGDSALDNQESNISSGVQTDSNENIENIQEPRTPENQHGNPYFNTSTIGPSVSQTRQVTERSAGNREDQNNRRGEFPRILYGRPVYDLGTGQRRYPDTEGYESPANRAFLEAYLPRSAANREEEPSLETMMMNMRRNAENNLRARFMPVIRNRVPENDREELIRLFEECVRDSRERARLRYRNMGQTIVRQPNQRPSVFESSDSSSTEDERDSLHMNFYIRSRNENSSRTESRSDNGSNTQRSRGNGIPSGNSSYHNINNLESWVTSLFNDVDSASANSNDISPDRSSNNRSTSMLINTLLDRPPRMNSHTTSRNRNNPNIPMNNNSSSLPEEESSPPNPVGNTSTGTTNSTSYSLANRRLDPGQSQRLGVRPLPSPTVINNFPRDEVINFSEFPNSEDDPFLAPERTEPSTSSSSETFHPFNPPPNLPAINPENIGIGNMYSNIVQDLETSLSNARDTRILENPGEMSSILSNFANRLETLMNQSEGILRNLRTSVDVLPDNDPLEYAEEAPVPTASFNDSTFFVRDQSTEGTSPGRNFNDPLEYDTHPNTATSDHTYPRNSDTASSSPNMNETMSPLMSSLHLTLSHIQSQSRLLHRQVECIERIDRAMVEVAQLQLMRLLLVELSTYVRNLAGESRSTSMSSVRQMMAGTRISDSSPSDNQNTRDDDETPIYDPGPSTSSGSRGTNQSSSARSRGLTRKTYPPSRLNRPRDAGSTTNSQDQSSSTNRAPLPSVAPRHTYSHINLFTLIRMDRRLQSLIDDHSTRFSYFNEHIPGGSRRQYNEIGEHNLALRIRESINRTNRLLGNIFNANVVKNYRIDSSHSLRHGMERFYERTLLSLIIDGISSHLDDNRGSRIPSDIRTRMQNVLQLAMIMSDLLLLYTINALAPATVPDLTLNTERNILANRISETCTTLIQCRQYRNFSNIFVTSLRSLRLMVSTYCSHNYTRYIHRRREFIRSQLATPHLAGSLDELNEVVDRGQISSIGTLDNADTTRESNDNRNRESNNSSRTGTNETRTRESNNSSITGTNETRTRESNNSSRTGTNETRTRESNNSSRTGTNETRTRESNNSSRTGTTETRSRQPIHRRGRQAPVTRDRESFNTRGGGSSDNASGYRPVINACLYMADLARSRRQRLNARMREDTSNLRSMSEILNDDQPSGMPNVTHRERLTQTLRTLLGDRNPAPDASTEPGPSSLPQRSDANIPSTSDEDQARANRLGELMEAALSGRHRPQNQMESNHTSEQNSEPTSRPSSQPNSSRSTGTRRRRSLLYGTPLSFERLRAQVLESEGRSTADVDEGMHVFQSFFPWREEDNRRRRQEGYIRVRERLHSEIDGTGVPPLRVRTFNNIYEWRRAQVENFWHEVANERNGMNVPRRIWSMRDTHSGSMRGTRDTHRASSSTSHVPSGSSRTNNTSEASEPLRPWRIPSVQVNDVPIELAPSQESSESDNSPTPAPQNNSQNNNNNSTYPRVMARLAAIRSVSVYNPIGVLRPRLLHPLYATLNPFDADLEQREHIYDSDVISTVTPNHRIQVWDISDSNIPDISDPTKNLVVRECKIHNDASVDMDSDGSILVTLLPSGGYLNITNRLGIYSLRRENLGQCLYTTSFVHNAVSVSLSPLGRHLVVGLASRRVSLLPNDRWMMASIFKIEEKDTPGDHLPFIRQIDRGSDDRATSHKSVNCIRWLPISGQGLIYATNTGQLNIWT